MKRSSSSELERATKRPRLDAHNQTEEKCLGIQEDATKSADIPPPNPDNAMDLIDFTTLDRSIHDLPLEILGNHIFKFFDFEYWLKNFVTVSKFWEQAAVQSTLDKQLRVRKVTAAGLIKRYRVSTLIIKFQAHLQEIALLINASPRVTSVKFDSDVHNFSNLLTPETIAKFTFNNVSTLHLEDSQLELCNFFPKALKLNVSYVYGFPGDAPTETFMVQEVALPESYLDTIKEALADTKRVLRAVHTIYFAVIVSDDEEEQAARTALDAISEELGVSLKYSCRSAIPKLSDISYDQFFNVTGTTPFCYALKSLDNLQQVFEHYPTLTLAYEQDFITRKKQFTFPQSKTYVASEYKPNSISWSQRSIEVLNLCFEKNMLPPEGLFYYYVKHDNYKAALEILISHNLSNVSGWIRENYTSLIKLRDDVGPDIFKKVVDTNFLYNMIFFRYNNYEDLKPVKELLSEAALQYTYGYLLSELRQERITDIQFQFLIQIDSWLHPASPRRESDIKSIGIQYLSDEAQVEYFLSVINYDYSKDKLEKDMCHASKPLHQMLHKGESLLAFVETKERVALLVKHFGLNVNQIYRNGSTPLIDAIKRKDGQVVGELLQLGADPNMAGNTLLPLHFCLSKTSYLSFHIISSLLTYGADINKKDFDTKGRTAWPITMALPHGAQVVKFLLDFGADPTVVDEAGNTLLHTLFRNEYCSSSIENMKTILKMLVPHIDINRKNKLGNSVLHCALTGRFVPVLIEALIQCGADLNLPDAQGYTPLLLSCHTPDTLQLLLATNQVDIKAKSKHGESLIAFVFMFLQSECAAYLKDEKVLAICKPYLTEDNIQFIKEECKKFVPKFDMEELVVSDITIAKFLVEHGYNVEKYSRNLLMWLDITDTKKNSEMWTYLLDNGLDIDAMDKSQETVLFALMKEAPFIKKRTDRVEFLLKHGASVTDKNKNEVAPIDIDPLIETRYANGLHVDYLVENIDAELPDVNLTELRQKNTT